MQLCARDRDNRAVTAKNALKQHNYLCIECHQTVRLRKGQQRQPHFYHLHPNQQCRQHGKGMPHLMLQSRLIEELPEGEAEMECRFAAIGRIADVAWHPQRLIFEIQCSPISSEEVQARIRDYAALGYRVVWIFHAERYNKQTISDAELAVSRFPHYFTNIDAEGCGCVFDQFTTSHGRLRTYKLPILPIDLTRPICWNEAQGDSIALHPLLQNRLTQWPLYFAGDTIDRTLDRGDPAWQQLIAALPTPHDPLLVPRIVEAVKQSVYKWAVAPYHTLFRYLLEKACR